MYHPRHEDQTTCYSGCKRNDEYSACGQVFNHSGLLIPLGRNQVNQLFHSRIYQFGRVEIDAICSYKEEIIFVEVKTRTSDMMAYPEQAVGKSKQRNIRLAAENYLEENQLTFPVRFDIIAVVKAAGL